MLKTKYTLKQPCYSYLMNAVAEFVAKVNDALINPFLALVFAAALLYFLFGLMVFMIGAEDEQKRAAGKQHMFWGLVGMLIMISVFTIIRVGLATLGVEKDDVPPELPLFN